MKPTPPKKTDDARGLIRHSRPSITPDDARAVERAVASGMLVGGSAVSAFEAAVARRAGTAHGCAVGSGTAALHLALAVLGVGPGDEVVLPAYVCASVLYAVRYVGAHAVLADVDPATGLSSADHVRAFLTKRTKAIVVVHLFGRAAPVDEIVSLGVPVVEDCAQSLGGALRGRPLGSWGTAGIFSFYATKVITTGYGGMVCSDDAGFIDRVRDLARYDERTDARTAYAYGMTSFQAALGQSQMARLDDFLARRRAIHDRYREAFSASGIGLSPAAAPGEDIHYRFVVKSDHGPDDVISGLGKRGITARRPIFAPLFVYEGTGELPGTRRAHDRDVSIPLYPALTDDEVKRVAGAVVAVMAGRS
jgi:perosamine synthetase